MIDDGDQGWAGGFALVTGLDRGHTNQTTGGELLEVIGDLLESIGCHTLPGGGCIGEVQLGLPIELRLLPIGAGSELGQLGLGEANLALEVPYRLEVGRIVLLECCRTLRPLVENSHDRLWTSRRWWCRR